MSWEIRYLPEVLDDFRALDGSQRVLVKKAIAKVRTNSLPDTEGGYGKRLGNKDNTQLAGFLKVKLRGGRIAHCLSACSRKGSYGLDCNRGTRGR